MTTAQRIAAELHDGAMQEITLARLQLDLLSTGFEDPVLLARLQEISDVLGEASVLLADLVRSITPGGIVQTSS